MTFVAEHDALPSFGAADAARSSFSHHRTSSVMNLRAESPLYVSI
jgi:hypothetical protein